MSSGHGMGGDSESDEEVVEHVQDDADSGEEFLYSSTAAGPSSGADPAMISSSSTLPGSTGGPVYRSGTLGKPPFVASAVAHRDRGAQILGIWWMPIEVCVAPLHPE